MVLQNIDPLHLAVRSSGQNDICFNIAFSFFKCLLHEEQSQASSFMKRINAFSREDVNALSHEMMLLVNKDLELNEQKTIIVVCVLYYVSYAFLNDAEEAILTRLAGESPEEMISLRNKFLHFSTLVVNFVKPHFAKRERFSHIIRWFGENGI